MSFHTPHLLTLLPHTHKHTKKNPLQNVKKKKKTRNVTKVNRNKESSKIYHTKKPKQQKTVKGNHHRLLIFHCLIFSKFERLNVFHEITFKVTLKYFTNQILK